MSSCYELAIYLSLLFNAMMRHRYCLCNICCYRRLYLFKNGRKSLNDSYSYRSVALGSVVGKIIDNITPKNHKYVLKSEDLQYGFKAGHSTTHCTFVLNEVGDYYLNNGSSVFY